MWEPGGPGNGQVLAGLPTPVHMDDASDLVPVPGRVSEAPAAPGYDGGVSLRRRRFGPVRSRLARLFGVQPTVEAHLDRLGAEAWRLMDGHRSAGAILLLLQREHPDEPDMARRLGQLLSTLASRGFITVGSRRRRGTRPSR